MSSSKRVLVVGGENATRNASLDEELARQGFEIRHSDAQTASNLWAATRSDVVILDLLAATASDERDVFKALARRLKQSGLAAHRPVIALADPEKSGLIAETVPDVDEVLYRPLIASELVSRIDAMRRLTTMQAEFARRIETAAHFGLDLPDIVPPGEIADADVLVVGDPRHFLVLESMLSAQAVLTGAFTADTAFEYLKRREFDAVVVAMEQPEALDLIIALRNNPALYNVPVIALAETVDERSMSEFFKAGATDVSSVGDRISELPGRVQALAREYRFRRRLTATYRSNMRLATSDSLTGLYSRGFLVDHLTRVLGDAERWSEPVTIAAFDIADLDTINAEHGFSAGDLVIRQIGEMIGRIVRGEDLAARWSGGRFVVVFTATERDDAEIATRRISAVTGSSQFSTDEAGEPFTVDIWSAIAAFEAGDTASTLLERAFGKLQG